MTTPRQMGFTMDTLLRCPAGHRLKRDAWLASGGAVRCRKRSGKLECGQWLYVFPPLAMPPFMRGAPEVGRMVFVVQATYAEVEAWMSPGVTLADICAQLGIWYWHPNP